jgi:protoporphyrinogen oxidase
MRVAVIGGGPAGMTAALELSRGGAHVEVFEAGDRVGGLARSLDLWGQRVDLGPHRFFSSDARVNRLWLSVVGRDFRMVNRLTRIYYRRRLFHYPLRAGNALWNMGLFNAAGCMASYLRQKCAPKSDGQDGTFESWVISRFGRRLFEMFFKTYSEKLWGISCKELDADFAAQRIKKFSLGEAVKTALGFGGQKHKTLVDRFAFPLQGTGMVYERMAEEVKRLGGKVHVNTPIAGVTREGQQVNGLLLKDGSWQGFDHIISTMPLTLLVRSLGQALPGNPASSPLPSGEGGRPQGRPGEVLPPAIQEALARLRYRNTVLVFLQVAGADLFPDQWLYVHAPEVGFGRIANFRNWVPEICGSSPNSILSLEYWCYDQDALWQQTDESLIQTAQREVAATGLSQGRPVLDGHVVRLHWCYPVYARGYKKSLEPVVEYVSSFRGLTPIGRYGAFKYNNQDHSILMGILAAQNILNNAGHDLWAVNTDYENYQESATITETGLVAATA